MSVRASSTQVGLVMLALYPTYKGDILLSGAVFSRISVVFLRATQQ